MSVELNKFRTRWSRWLGQKTRCDRDNWTDLLGSNYAMWPEKVFNNHGRDFEKMDWNPTEVFISFSTAIGMATMKELMQLDEIYASEKCR